MKHEVILIKANKGAALFLNGQLLTDSQKYAETEMLAKKLAHLLKVELECHTASEDHGDWQMLFSSRLRPSETVIHANILPVGDPSAYAEGEVHKPFLMEITDQREQTGRCNVVITAVSGHVDDMLCATLEVGGSPEDGELAPCLKLGFDPDNQAASFYKAGPGRYLIVLERDVTLREVRLASGKQAWVLG